MILLKGVRSAGGRRRGLWLPGDAWQPRRIAALPPRLRRRRRPCRSPAVQSPQQGCQVDRQCHSIRVAKWLSMGGGVLDEGHYLISRKFSVRRRFPCDHLNCMKPFGILTIATTWITLTILNNWAIWNQPVISGDFKNQFVTPVLSMKHGSVQFQLSIAALAVFESIQRPCLILPSQVWFLRLPPPIFPPSTIFPSQSKAVMSKSSACSQKKPRWLFNRMVCKLATNGFLKISKNRLYFSKTPAHKRSIKRPWNGKLSRK